MPKKYKWKNGLSCFCNIMEARFSLPRRSFLHLSSCTVWKHLVKTGSRWDTKEVTWNDRPHLDSLLHVDTFYSFNHSTTNPTRTYISEKDSLFPVEFSGSGHAAPAIWWPPPGCCDFWCPLLSWGECWDRRCNSGKHNRSEKCQQELEVLETFVVWKCRTLGVTDCSSCYNQ